MYDYSNDNKDNIYHFPLLFTHIHLFTILVTVGGQLKSAFYAVGKPSKSIFALVNKP